MDSLKIGTYNLRTAVAQDHPWHTRRDPMAQVIAGLAPDILGTQEGRPEMLDELTARLPGHYRWISQSRRGAQPDESTAVLYNTERLTALDVAHRWLSATPLVPGSTDWGNTTPRMFTRVRFHDSETDTVFSVINNHVDHLSEESRVKGAEQLVAEVGSGREPTIVLGDFNNDAETSAAYQILVEAGLVDVVRARSGGQPVLGTFNNYLPAVVGESRIDWILTTPDIRSLDARIVDEAPGGTYPSDHLPVITELVLPSR